ncbi:hypothetical protein ACFR9U_14230 [Halorientalis brevis]|uniref:Uncharacterized protein n=1 Tax=Halorientalis brevis TaxID=1126241 RepID=A0ABD6CEB5_9EURY|nr:hypothetical protein [Halorientalis brevis]
MYLEKYRTRRNRFLAINIGAILVGAVVIGTMSVFFPSQSTIGLNIGLPIIAAGAVRMFDYKLFKLGEQKELVDDLVQEWGILDIQGGRGRAEKEQYEELMLRCNDKLHIQAISLSRFQNDLGDVLDRLGNQNVEIRLLLLDPESQICDWYGDADTERGDLESTIRDSTNRFLEREIDSLEVRYYEGLPTNYFRVDSEAFVGPYFMSEPSRKTLTFLGRTDGDLVNSYTKNFDALWEDSRVPDPAE